MNAHDHDHCTEHCAHDHDHCTERCAQHRRGVGAAMADLVCDVVTDVVELIRRCACGSGCRCSCSCHSDPGSGGHGGDGSDDGEPGTGAKPGTGSEPGTGRVPWRPTREPGTSTGDLSGRPLTGKDLKERPGPTVWVGPRSEMYLPFLFLRAHPGDTGTRPVAGPFWESPDVFILPGVAPNAAPPVPPQLGQVALAGDDNTVYAHVWNLGRGQARNVVVEFYWCNPSLGFNPVGAHKIGTAVTWLGARGSGDCHKVVKCPKSWVATYANGGHECLLIRAWDVAADPLTTPDWDASINRHLGQRNIHVVPAAQRSDEPLGLSVGQLYGHQADIAVSRHAPATMPWLQVHSGVRGQFPGQAVGTGALTLAAPGQLGDSHQLQVGGDDAQVVFATGDQPPPPGQGHVYRVTASQQGQVIGGYTVVLLG